MKTEFQVTDATCGHCKQTIEGAVATLDGVSRAELDLQSKVIEIEHDDAISADELSQTIAGAGYTPTPAS